VNTVCPIPLVLSTEVLSDFFDTDATFTIDDDNDFFATHSLPNALAASDGSDMRTDANFISPMKMRDSMTDTDNADD